MSGGWGKGGKAASGFISPAPPAGLGVSSNHGISYNPGISFTPGILASPLGGCPLHCCYRSFFIVVIVHSWYFDSVCIVGKIVAINLFERVPEAIIETESHIFVVGICEHVDTVDDVGWWWEGHPFLALTMLACTQVEEPVWALYSASGAKADSWLTPVFLGVEGFWTLMGFSICTKLELAVFVKYRVVPVMMVWGDRVS